MSYIINKTDGTELVTINPNTINNDYGITLIGRSYLDYGQVLNENLVHMLEHFANDTPPNNPLEGQLWMDVTNENRKILRVRKNNQWEELLDVEKFEPEVSSGPALPAQGDEVGDLFWNSSTKSLWVWTPDSSNPGNNFWLQLFPPVDGTVNRIQNSVGAVPSNIKFVDTQNSSYPNEITIGVDSLTPRIRLAPTETIINNTLVFGGPQDLLVNGVGRYTKQQYSQLNNLGNISGTFTINFDIAQVSKFILTGNSTVNVINKKSGAIYIMIVQQDSIGNRTLTFPSAQGFLWSEGNVPSLTNSPWAVDIFTFLSIHGTLYGTGLFNFA